jgi:hypothetical protein
MLGRKGPFEDEDKDDEAVYPATLGLAGRGSFDA